MDDIKPMLFYSKLPPLIFSQFVSPCNLAWIYATNPNNDTNVPLLSCGTSHAKLCNLQHLRGPSRGLHSDLSYLKFYLCCPLLFLSLFMTIFSGLEIPSFSEYVSTLFLKTGLATFINQCSYNFFYILSSNIFWWPYVNYELSIHKTYTVSCFCCEYFKG